jgi:glyceraldehyde 3-phosphate dehydrogenase
LAVRIGINGFGNIGRRFLRGALDAGLEVVAINDLWDAKTLAHLLKYDSTYGTLSRDVRSADGQILVDGKGMRLTAERDPAKLAWAEAGVNVVVESTGRFKDRASAEKHIAGGAKRVVISAPAKGDDLTCVMGVNDRLYDPARHTVISNASCTTNCLAPVAKVLDEKFGIISGFMTTVHAYTNEQVILDLPHGDIRRARAAAANIIPTSTGAASAIGNVLPSLKGKLNGIAMRVPVPSVSVLDLVVKVTSPATKDEVNATFMAAAAGPLSGILAYTDEELVSSDFKGDPHSATVDGPQTMCIGDMVKVVAWYDNEWAYSMRLVDICKMIGDRGV